MTRKITRAFRRTLLAGLATALAIGTVLGAATGPVQAGAGGDEEFVLGSGRADARVLRAGPSAAQLGLTPSVALSLADFLGTRGRGESRMLDYAALDGTFEDNMPEEYLEATSPMRIESVEEDSASGRSAQRGPFHQAAWATDAPSGRSESRVDAIEIPGALMVSGGKAEARAGVVEIDGRPARQAGGAVSIGRIELAGGAVVLRNLRWEVVQRTVGNDDPEPQVEGLFVVGSATIGGDTHHGPITGAELDLLFEQANTALAPTGLMVDVPRVDGTAGVARVTPLAVRIVDSEVGRQVLGPVIGGPGQDVRDNFVTPFLEECEDCSVFVLIADVVVGVLSGAGSLDIELGGAFGFTEGETFENPFGDLGTVAAFDPPDLSQPAPLGADPTPAAPAPRAPAAEEAAPAEDGPATDPSREVAAPIARQLPGSDALRGSLASALAAIVLFGMVGTSAYAIAEYRQLRARRIGLGTS